LIEETGADLILINDDQVAKNKPRSVTMIVHQTSLLKIKSKVVDKGKNYYGPCYQSKMSIKN